MKVLVVGGGGREHTIVWKLSKSPKVTEIYAAPGNGGIAELATCVPIKATDIDGVVNFAYENKIDLTVVAPDDPLVAGMVDALEAKGLRAFGPNKAAAIIEGSKVYSKELMEKYNIPTAACKVFTDANECMAYIKSQNTYPTVIKAEGLALGKGVIIAQTEAEAETAIDDIMVKKIFGDSGNRVVIEEFLTGPEVSVLTFTDGKTIVPMVSAQDHKRAYDNDMGPNTGGMGTFSPSRVYTKEIADICMKEIFVPTMEGLNKENRKFKGVIFFGLMITKNGPKVIEYNCRFGDPETQVVLPRLKGDLFEIMMAVSEQRLADVNIEWDDNAAVCVVAASGGYPKKYATGYEISGMADAESAGNIKIFHAGTKNEDGKVLTSGGRVLGITAVSKDLDTAIKDAYAAVEKVSFTDMHYRKDIGVK
ncbi:MAG: phosphoribosylamine--glycine ligase [Clostridia bacterium]|nr:phosphoribosylamine--glycine ligase [Clostridia bacterium]MBR2878399.1 phosphoribosylamine--glycine ligase [Clostridia bacterium]MBR2973479.1 phosphoribosylamine--glycine ligase [Clostridia bacterium]MBR3575801.1 phosphoribosylamine--glycine ligase [Clostridia bacterium]